MEPIFGGFRKREDVFIGRPIQSIALVSGPYWPRVHFVLRTPESRNNIDLLFDEIQANGTAVRIARGLSCGEEMPGLAQNACLQRTL
jgi:hypothetical protein